MKELIKYYKMHPGLLPQAIESLASTIKTRWEPRSLPGWEPSLETIDTTGCKLCEVYKRCDLCPIGISMQMHGCRGTPYADWVFDPSPASALEELKFLQNLKRELERLVEAISPTHHLVNRQSGQYSYLLLAANYHLFNDSGEKYDGKFLRRKFNPDTNQEWREFLSDLKALTGLNVRDDVTGQLYPVICVEGYLRGLHPEAIWNEEKEEYIFDES